MQQYNLSSNDGKVITRYYNYDQVMEVDEQRRITCSVTYPLETIIDHDVLGDGLWLEMVGGDRCDLSVMSFPLNRAYHHERQSIVFTKTLENGLILELEMLVQDILDPKERNIADLVKNIDEEEDNPIISLSFCFTLQPRAYRAALAAVATLMK
jgi:hypothetical protein